MIETGVGANALHRIWVTAAYTRAGYKVEVVRMMHERIATGLMLQRVSPLPYERDLARLRLAESVCPRNRGKSTRRSNRIVVSGI